MWKWLVPILMSLAAPALAERPVFGPPPAPGTAIWYGIHWIDLSTEGAINGTRPDETARVAMIADYVADDLTARGFTLMAPPPEAAALLNPARSNGADVKLARAGGADYAISGEVHKVSNLILSVNLYVRDAETGRDLRAGAVDIRGNTDESYRHGYRYLLKNIIFRKEN
ncbi:MAG: DUF3280 domain-containing protein [Paracoccus sp. (in: a-proteobacteria)]|nr:DUF3280 domain-containing protein [Paracoccus sp. (in: a-proteobacteria)]